MSVVLFNVNTLRKNHFVLTLPAHCDCFVPAERRKGVEVVEEGLFLSMYGRIHVESSRGYFRMVATPVLVRQANKHTR